MKLIPSCRKAGGRRGGRRVLYMPERETWAIRLAGQQLFDLKTLRPATSDGLVLDFGTDYSIKVDPTGCFELSAIGELPEGAEGSLCRSSENGDETRHQIFLDRDIQGGRSTCLNWTQARLGRYAISAGRLPRLELHLLRVTAWTPTGHFFEGRLEDSLRQHLLKEVRQQREAGTTGKPE